MKNKAVYWFILLFSLTSCLPRHEIVRQGDSKPGSDASSRPAGRNDSPQADQNMRERGGGSPAAGTSAGNTSLKAGTSIAGMNYVERYRNIAIEEMNRHGIPASIKLAQGLLESGNGSSRLAVEANNHFGIKCTGDWEGSRTYQDDDAENDCFRVYKYAEESFRDHSQFLLRRRYEKLFALDKKDYRAWAAGLKEAGYATNPRYAELLVDLIERYELYQYDSVDHSLSIASGSGNKVYEDRTDKVLTNEDRPVISKETGSAAIPPVTKTPVVMKIHEVAEGENAAMIANRYGLSVQELLTVNGLRSQDLHRGQLLIVSKSP